MIEKRNGGNGLDFALLLEYGWVLLVLIGLEGILAADNALVMAVMVKHLPEKQRKKALFYGLAGAFILRFGSLFAISFLVNVWQVQAVGALYLFYIAVSHLLKRYVFKDNAGQKTQKESGFWQTVLKVELADIAFAVDSILAAVALAVTLPNRASCHRRLGRRSVSRYFSWRRNRFNHYAFCGINVRILTENQAGP